MEEDRWRSSKDYQLRCGSDTVRHILNPFHPNISVHILHTVPYTIPKELIRRICLSFSSK